MHLITTQLSMLIGILFILLTLAAPTLTYQAVSDDTLTHITRPSTDFDIHNGSILSPILRPRIPGTPNSAAIRGHFTNYFSKALPKWSLESQTSTAKNPFSSKAIPITNFIAVRDPPDIPKGNISRLTLVAHYDTKQTPPGFIGAIDSAAPCAIIMHAVHAIDAALTHKWTTSPKPQHSQGIQVIFTDGEEGFGDTDITEMLYGARSLAAEWERSHYPAPSRYTNRLSAISLFVLLDLLGARDPRIASYYIPTHDVYNRVAMLEKRLRGLRQFRSTGSGPWFVDGDRGRDRPHRYPIYDDQVPFAQQGVDVLHFIDADPETGRFPKVWHTLKDNGENLDIDGMRDWSVLMTAFVVEWLELEGYMA
jgi:hypothetical protein